MSKGYIAQVEARIRVGICVNAESALLAGAQVLKYVEDTYAKPYNGEYCFMEGRYIPATAQLLGPAVNTDVAQEKESQNERKDSHQPTGDAPVSVAEESGHPL